MFFSEMINDRQDKISIDYSRFFENKPTFVTYFSQDSYSSTEEPSLDDTVGLLGKESPIKFNKVENFPLFEFEGTENVSEDDTDFGKDTVIEGSAAITPRTLKPLEEDMFIIEHDNDRNIFKVNNVVVDKISGHQFYKIEFKIYKKKEEDILDQIHQEFVTDYENIGSEYKTIVSKSDRIIINNLKNLHNILADFYVKSFIDKDLNCVKIEVEEENTYYYDPIITRFLRDNELLLRTDRKFILENIYLEEIDLKNLTKMFYDIAYKTSLYNYISNGIKGANIEIFDLSYFLMNNSSLTNELGFTGETILISQHGAGTEEIFDSEFRTKIVDNVKYDDDERKMEDIVIGYLNGEINKDNLSSKLENLEIEDDEKSFFFIPIILFIIKTVFNNLTIEKGV